LVSLRRFQVKKVSTLFVFFILLTGLGLSFAKAEPSVISPLPVKGMVTMIDLGADKCIPCRMMAPILSELKETYKDKAAIVFIDVWENPGEAEKYGIRAIPTQIFFDREGQEAYRHIGFMDRESIVAVLERLGVK
jgi:thioredoxin 1